MRLLLDTHIALWAFADDAQLPALARALLLDDGNDVYCSVAAACEVAVKHDTHPDRMRVSGSEFERYRAASGFKELSIEARHVLALESLRRGQHAPRHNDPFDRIMLAQAKADGLFLVSHDSLLRGYGEECLLSV